MTESVSPATETTRPAETTSRWPGALGVLLAASALAVAGGLSGLLAAAVVGVGWYVLPPPAAFAVGQFALVAVVSPDGAALGGPSGTALGGASGTALLVVAEVGLLGLLAGPTLAAVRSVRVAALAGGCIALLAAGGWVGYRWLGSVSRTAAVLGAGFALAAYGLHRYERAALGLVSDASHDHE